MIADAENPSASGSTESTSPPAGVLPPDPGPLWLQILSFPRSHLGWWAVIFEVGFIILITFFQVLIASGQRGGTTYFSNPLLAVTLLTAISSAIAGMAFGLYSFVRRRERSLLVFIAILLGLFVLIFAIGEIGGHGGA